MDANITSFSDRFRNKLFRLSQNLIRFKHIGPNLGATLLFLQLIQSLFLTYNGNNTYVAHFFHDIKNPEYFLQIYPLVDRYLLANRRIAMNLLLLFFVLGIFISLIIMANRRDYTRNIHLQLCAYLLICFYEFASKFLFVPIFGTFIVTMKCNTDLLPCFSSQYIVLLVSSVIGIILLLIVCYIIEVFFYNSSSLNKDSLAHTPMPDFAQNLVYKTIAVILTVGVFDLEYNLFVSIYHFLFNCHFLLNSVKKVTYFDTKVSFMHMAACAILTWTNGILAIAGVVKNDKLQDYVNFIIIAGSIFCVILSYRIKKHFQPVYTAVEVEMPSA